MQYVGSMLSGVEGQEILGMAVVSGRFLGFGRRGGGNVNAGSSYYSLTLDCPNEPLNQILEGVPYPLQRLVVMVILKVLPL